MIRTDKLRGIFAERGMSMKDVAKLLGIRKETMYHKMHRGIFLSNEMQIMIDSLNIENPIEIFFAPNVPEKIEE